MERDPLGAMSLDPAAAATPCQACGYRSRCAVTAEACEAFASYLTDRPATWRRAPREPSAEIGQRVFDAVDDDAEQVWVPREPPPPKPTRCARCDESSDQLRRGLCKRCYNAELEAERGARCVQCRQRSPYWASGLCRPCGSRARGECCADCGAPGVQSKGLCSPCYQREWSRARRAGGATETVETETPEPPRMG